jgi:hypothetical protein
VDGPHVTLIHMADAKDRHRVPRVTVRIPAELRQRTLEEISRRGWTLNELFLAVAEAAATRPDEVLAYLNLRRTRPGPGRGRPRRR